MATIYFTEEQIIFLESKNYWNAEINDSIFHINKVGSKVRAIRKSIFDLIKNNIQRNRLKSCKTLLYKNEFSNKTQKRTIQLAYRPILRILQKELNKFKESRTYSTSNPYIHK